MMLSWCSHRGICCHPVPVGRESFGCFFLPRQWRFLSPLQRFPCSKSEQSTCSVPSTKLFSLSSLQSRFPSNSWKIGSSTPRISVSSQTRNATIVLQAKKQTYSSLDDLLAQADKPVLVDFYATWCGPCQFMVPILNEVSTRLKGKIRVVKIDTEKYPSIANQYAIEALPTFILFKNGKPYDRFEGALTENQLIHRIEESLKVKQ